MSYYFGKYEDGAIKVRQKLNETKSNKDFIEKLYVSRGFELTSKDGSEWVNGRKKTGDLTGKYKMEVMVKRDNLSVEKEAELLEETKKTEEYVKRLEGTIVMFNDDKKKLVELNKITVGNMLKFENGMGTIVGNIHKGENGFFISNSKKEKELNLSLDEYIRKGKAIGISVRRTVAQNGDTYIGFTKNIVPSKDGEFNEAKLLELAGNKSFVAIKEIQPLSLINGNNLFMNKSTKISLLASRQDIKEEAEIKEETKASPKAKTTAKKEAIKVVKDESKTSTKAKTEKPKADKKVEAKKETKPKADKKPLYDSEPGY